LLLCACDKKKLGTMSRQSSSPKVEQLTLSGLLLERLLLRKDGAENTIEVLIDFDFSKDEMAPVRDEFGKTNGCFYIVEAMKQHAASVSMQWKCCKLLLFLTYRHEKNNFSFHKCGAAKAVVIAMKKFAKNRDMQYYGCGALCNLAFLSAENVVEAGGVEAVVEAMKEFPAEENVQVYSCGCLKALAAHGKFKRQLLDAGAPKLLIDSESRFHGKNEKVETVAHEALQYMYSSK
jgi:hypothetical protein